MSHRDAVQPQFDPGLQYGVEVRTQSGRSVGEEPMQHRSGGWVQQFGEFAEEGIRSGERFAAAAAVGAFRTPQQRQSTRTLDGA